MKQIRNKYGLHNMIDYKKFIRDLLDSLSNEIKHYTIRNKHRILILGSTTGYTLRGRFIHYDKYNTGTILIDEYIKVFDDLLIPLTRGEIISPLPLIIIKNNQVSYHKYLKYLAYSDLEMYLKYLFSDNYIQKISENFHKLGEDKHNIYRWFDDLDYSKKGIINEVDFRNVISQEFKIDELLLFSLVQRYYMEGGVWYIYLYFSYKIFFRDLKYNPLQYNIYILEFINNILKSIL